MTVIYQLKKHQYDLLRDVADGVIPNPDRSEAFAAVDDRGEVVGKLYLIAPVHVENVWVREDHRGTNVLNRMVQAAEKLAKSQGLKILFAFATTSENEDYLRRMGYKLEDWKVMSRCLR